MGMGIPISHKSAPLPKPMLCRLLRVNIDLTLGEL